MSADADVRLLSGADIRRHAARLGLRPAKSRGQNFVTDPNTVRRIVRVAGVQPGETVLEVGPGLGSLTLGLLEAVGPDGRVVAVELDPVLADALPQIAAEHAGPLASRLQVVTGDALAVTRSGLPAEPTRLVANLPYNVAVPVLLHMLAELPALDSALVMVQLEVAERLAAGPGSRSYGIPSVKAAWFGDVTLQGRVGPKVFWPVPRVDSGLVRIERREPPPPGAEPGPVAGREVPPTRAQVFACVDAAFSQRRKTLRSSLARWAGSKDQADAVLARAEVDPGARAETLGVDDFVRLAAARDLAVPHDGHAPTPHP